MDHHDLCVKTANWALKKNKICLCDYQATVSCEFPDVLAFDCNGLSTLYEIKVSRSDFLSDHKKASRQNLRPKIKSFPGMPQTITEIINGEPIKKRKWRWYYRKHFKEQPHLGIRRFYVCPEGLIDPKEVDLFGLYWYKEKNGYFYKKKDSEIFRANLRRENMLLQHAVQAVYYQWNHKIFVKSEVY